MAYEQIILAESEGILSITFNRPEKLNAFTFRMLAEINEVLNRRIDQSVRAVVFRGAGRAFSAGDDLVNMGGTNPLDDMRRGHHAMIKRIRALRLPVVAAIHGYGLGAAFDLALACDFRLAARSAELGDVRINRAINSMSGAAFWLPRYVGVGRASEILMLGERIGAPRCVELGLVTRVFPDDAFDAGIQDFLGVLRKLPTKVVGANKALLNVGLQTYLDAALDTEARELLESFRTEDYREGASAWLDKRAPRYTGR
jgi:2-(1,2-epoxy-1,2-dihydrophenyl)acetyl-CoA isomerase